MDSLLAFLPFALLLLACALGKAAITELTRARHDRIVHEAPLEHS